MLKKLKQFYRYIVYDESLTSLVLSTVISLLFIIFIFYPLLGWSLNSNFPIVAIQSGSMHHEGSFENWWGSKADCSNTFCKQSEYYTNINITKNDFFSLKISLPTLLQQKQIAKTLNTTKKEITILEGILAKYKSQKKGLMQKLLTGKIRVNNINSIN